MECVGTSVPAALALQEEMAGNLQVLLVERNHTLQDVEEVVRERSWPTASALWTVGPHFKTPKKSVPNYLLLSPEGEVVREGDPVADFAQIQAYVRGFRLNP